MRRPLFFHTDRGPAAASAEHTACHRHAGISDAEQGKIVMRVGQAAIGEVHDSPRAFASFNVDQIARRQFLERKRSVEEALLEEDQPRSPPALTRPDVDGAPTGKDHFQSAETGIIAGVTRLLG